MMNERHGDEIEYAWWPSGVDEQLVRECNCGYCSRLADRLDHERAAERGDRPATDDGDLSLHAFAE